MMDRKTEVCARAIGFPRSRDARRDADGLGRPAHPGHRLLSCVRRSGRVGPKDCPRAREALRPSSAGVAVAGGRVDSFPAFWRCRRARTSHANRDAFARAPPSRVDAHRLSRGRMHDAHDGWDVRRARSTDHGRVPARAPLRPGRRRPGPGSRLTVTIPHPRDAEGGVRPDGECMGASSGWHMVARRPRGRGVPKQMRHLMSVPCGPQTAAPAEAERGSVATVTPIRPSGPPRTTG